MFDTYGKHTFASPIQSGDFTPVSHYIKFPNFFCISSPNNSL